MIAMHGSTKLPPYRVLPEPPLARRRTTPSPAPTSTAGLLEHGPYSKSAFAILKPKLRVATIAPEDAQAHVFQFLKSLQTSIRASGRTISLPSPFEAVFGVPIHGAHRDAHVYTFDTITADQGDMHSLGEALRRGLDRLQSMRDEFDVVAIYLPDRWQPGFEDFERTRPPPRDQELRRRRRALDAVPSRVRALSYFDRCSVAWRLGIAFYAKAGGTPWRLVPNAADTAYIALLCDTRRHDGQVRHCCSQVFDADGGGMEFVAYDVARRRRLRKPVPEPRRHAGGDVAQPRGLSGRNAGRLPRRVVIHKTQAFRDEEVDGCIDAWDAPMRSSASRSSPRTDWRAVRLLGARTGWRGRRRTAKRSAARSFLLRPQRLALHQRGRAIVAVRGYASKEARGIPRPITLVRHAGAGPLERLGRTRSRSRRWTGTTTHSSTRCR